MPIASNDAAVSSELGEGIVVAPRGARPLGRRFRYLWATFLVASLGDGVGYGAVPLLALVVDPHPIAVSGVAAADTFPWLVLALPAGALADRYERGRVMALTNMGRAVVLVALAILVATQRIDYLALVILVFLNGGARAIYYSASQATVPELVEANDFPRANGILSGTEAATEHLGGPVAGTLAFSAIKALPFVADAVAIGLSGLSLLRFRTGRLNPKAAHGSILDGVRQLVKDRSLRLLVTLLAALAGLQGLVMGVLVIIATVDWGVSKGLYGLFLAAGAAGNVPGALLADRVSHRIGNVPTLIASALVSGLAYLVMASARGWVLAGSAFFVVCFVVSVGSVMANSLRQRLSPPDLMGRVGSAWRGVVWGAFPIGSLFGGVIAQRWGIRIPLWTAGLAQCAVALVIAGPLYHSLAASRTSPSSTGEGTAGPAVKGDKPFQDSPREAAGPASGIDHFSPRVRPGRRVHSRPGHGPLSWGRSSRNGRR